MHFWVVEPEVSLCAQTLILQLPCCSGAAKGRPFGIEWYQGGTLQPALIMHMPRNNNFLKCCTHVTAGGLAKILKTGLCNARKTSLLFFEGSQM